MITSDRFERRLPELLAELAGSDDAGFLRDVLEATSTTRQRRPWRQSGLWNPAGLLGRGTEVGHSPALRMFVAAGLVLLLVLAAFAAGSSPNRVVPPSPSPSRSASPSASASLEPVASGPLQRTQALAFGPRHGASAIVLADGRVLVVGGADPRAELYDPATSQFDASGTMATPRIRPMVALLRDGRVLVAGGMHVAASGNADARALATAEIFDPATGSFEATGTLRFGRWTCCDLENPSAITLLDGRVMVVGGRQQDPAIGLGSGSLPPQAEIYDPAAGALRQLDVGCDATQAAHVRLRDGRVLVTCRQVPAGTGLDRARIFDPSTDAFSETGRPTTAGNRIAALTRDGRVLLTGSLGGSGSAEIFDPRTGLFRDLENARGPAPDQPAVSLKDGGILFVGAGGQRWFYFGATEDRLSGYGPVSAFADSPEEPAAVLLRDGRVLVVGNAPYGVLFQ